MLRCKSKQKSLPRGKVFQIHGVGLASRKSASLERGKLCIGCAIMNGYFSSSYFVQNENTFCLEIIAKNKPQNNPNSHSFPFHLKINIFIKWAYSGKHNLVVKGTKHLLSLKYLNEVQVFRTIENSVLDHSVGATWYISLFVSGESIQESSQDIYTHIGLI